MPNKLKKAIIGVKALWAQNIKRDPTGFMAPTLVIMLSDRCNYRCITCNCYEIGDKTKELTTEQWSSVMDDFKRLGGFSVRFTGGEAFLRKKTMYQLIDQANRDGLSPKISTNGSLIRDADIKSLQEHKVDLVEISFHGRETNHEEYVKIKGSHQRTLDVIDKLIGIGVTVRLAFTIIKSNLGDIEYIVNLAKERSISVSFNMLDNSLYYFKDLDQSIFPTDDDMVKASQTLIELKGKYPNVVNGSIKAFAKVPELLKDTRLPEYYCARALMNIYIDSFGNVYHGCWAMPSSGNLQDKSLAQILDSPEYTSNRKKGFNKECPGCTCAYQMDMDISLFKRKT